ncbi:DUF2061 domain-containing protein [Candidatus Bathyarchaeota archaeon]|nr:DUF2061 domain-containing protein [Candidatus Bathyarchaeota archaeon]
MDSKLRSIVKAATWRIIALFLSIIISFAIIGSWSVSVAIGVATNLLKTLVYYIHERLWEKINWGRK